MSIDHLFRTAGVFDPVLDNRMDWLWAWDDRRKLAYVKEEVLDRLEGEFYEYLEQQGWPGPVSDWVLAMGIQGGAASYQWNDTSDVDVMVVLDWLKLFAEMGKWTLAQFTAVDLAEQHVFVARGGRVSGRHVKRKLEQCISGRGVWQGKGIRNKAVLKQLAPTHPIDYSIQRGLHHGDMRFDGQPPIVDASNLSSYLVDLPTKRQRDEKGRGKDDTVWMNEIKKPPTGFNLEKDAPELYQKGIGSLRGVTMPFDFLYDPSSPKDIVKGMEVLGRRFSEFMKGRTEGYRAWAKNPGLYSVTVNGETYGHPDWFPNNIGVKLLESTGPKDGKKLIKEILRKKRTWGNIRYVQRNFGQVKAEIRAFLGPNYVAIRRLMAAKWKGRPFRFKNPRVASAKIAKLATYYGSQVSTTPEPWMIELENLFQKKWRRANIHIDSSISMGSVVDHRLKVGKYTIVKMEVGGWSNASKTRDCLVYPNVAGTRGMKDLFRRQKDMPDGRKVFKQVLALLTPEGIATISGSRGKPDPAHMAAIAVAVKAAKHSVINILPGADITWNEWGSIASGEYTLQGEFDPDGGEDSWKALKMLEVKVSFEDKKYTVSTLGQDDFAKTPRGMVSLLDKYLRRMMNKGLRALDPYVKELMLGKISPDDVIRKVLSATVEYEYVDGKSFSSRINLQLRKRTKKEIPGSMIMQWVKDNWREVQAALPKKAPPTYGQVHGVDSERDRHMADMVFPDVRSERHNELAYRESSQEAGNSIAHWSASAESAYRVEYHVNDDGYDDEDDEFDDEDEIEVDEW